VRTDPQPFAARNLAAHKAPRFVVCVEFPSPLYLSSHADITGVPATHLAGCLIEPSVSSQKINPDEGRAEIGAASFSVADLGGQFTSTIRDLQASGYGLRDKTCRFYLGYEGLAWSDFVLVGTQIVKSAAFDKGAYRVSCNDVQRAARKDIFNLAGTTISGTVEPGDTTINVYSTAGFETVKHGTSYTDAASSTVGYLKIKDEIIRYTGKTSTSFTGCTRGVLGTAAGRYVADGATAAARREKVAEYVYLELPGPKLAYAILTGVLHGDSANLPASWHLGIQTSLVLLADFTGIGVDLWDTGSDANGVVLRFEGLTKADGKAFLELEALRLLGLFMPVYADGLLGLRRMTRVLMDAASVAVLDESNSVMVGDLEHDMESLHNNFAVLWNWNGKDYTRTTQFLDATSAAKHGRAPEMELKFKGLYGGRHTDGLIFKLLDAIRDRYSAPPCRLRVDVLHSLNRIEVGDVVRVRHACLRDYAGSNASIDRAFEVQSISVNHRTGNVALELFGSTSTAAAITPTVASSALPDAFYTAAGTALSTLMTITSGVVSGGPYTLTGSSDLTASGAIFYHAGDLTIPAGVTINITGNVQLRVRGYLTINGTIAGSGGGLAGVTDNSAATPVLGGNSGWVGNSRGLDGVVVVNTKDGKIVARTNPPLMTTSKHPSFPYVALEVSGNTLKGLPTDLRGSGGAPGGKVVKATGTFYKSGGPGGAGGAGLCLISRGLGVGAGGTITLNGANTAAQSGYLLIDGLATMYFLPGTGGAGGPGSLLVLIDGALLSVPDLSGRFTARSGTVAAPSYTTALSGTGEEKFKLVQQPIAGYLADPSSISGLDLSFSCQRIQFIPAPETAVEDSQTVGPVGSVSATKSSSGYVVTFTPSSGTPLGAIFEVWEYTAATPFSSATKRAEGLSTAFFIPRGDTATVYVWVRARVRTEAGGWAYSASTPAADGLPTGAAAVSGTYATATPASVSGSAASSSITTASITASLVGGTGSTFAWARQSGSASISANSASAATTTFTATGVGTGATVSAVFRCTINSTETVDVAVDCTNTGNSLSVSASPSSVSKTENSASITTATVTAAAAGGSGGYSYAWAKKSGGSITANSTSAAATTFTAATLTAGEARAATFTVTATDSASATATFDVSITITRAALSVSVSDAAPYKLGSTYAITTDGVTATPVSGTGPYTWSWGKVSGGSILPDTPTSATTTFTAINMSHGASRTAVYRITCTDTGSSQSATADVTVNIERTG
jgi:hypothetical protein